MDTSFFKAYDIRGVIGKELDAEKANRIGKALGTMINGASIAVGMDARFSSKQIYQPFMDGLVSAGCKVVAIGLSPSPLLYFTAWQKKIYGAIITASHNPAEYTGFKLVEPNGCSFVDQYAELAKIYEQGKFLEKKGSVINEDAYPAYRDFLKSKIKIGKKIKVVVECLYASGGLLLPKLYKELGLEVIPSHCVPKADFNGERPEPKGENLKEMSRLIIDNAADFGVGLDGDCDRSVIMDDKGLELNGSMSSAIFIKNILPLQPKGHRNVVATIDCNSELKQLTESLGGKLTWSDVGHGFIGKNVLDNNAVYGGEMSSHMWFEYYPFSDGFICGLKMAEILSSGKKLSALVDEIKFCPMLKEYVNCGTHEKKEKVKDALIEKYRNMPEAAITRDGIKFFLNDLEWVLLRKSNNLPEVCLVIEAKDKERLEQLHKEYRAVMDKIIGIIK